MPSAVYHQYFHMPKYCSQSWKMLL